MQVITYSNSLAHYHFIRAIQRKSARQVVVFLGMDTLKVDGVAGTREVLAYSLICESRLLEGMFKVSHEQ